MSSSTRGPVLLWSALTTFALILLGCLVLGSGAEARGWSSPVRAAPRGAIAQVSAPITLCESLNFAPPVTYTLGTTPRSAVSGDFNHDNRTDVVVSNYSGNSVSVFLNNGDGTFQQPVTYGTNTHPVTIAIGDLNEDTNPDLIVANFDHADVSVLLGNANGTFQAASSFSSNTGPYGVTVGDFNEDGHIDVATSNVNFGTINVMLGNGNGTLQGPVQYQAGQRPQVISTADFNGDHHLDLVVPNYTASTVSVFLGNGDGTFQARVTHPVDPYPDYLTVADLNQDTYPDLITTHYTSTINVSVLLGNPDGSFQPPATYATGGDNPLFASVADFNGDGIPDVAAANYGSGTFAILQGNGDGTLQAAHTFQVDNLSRPVAVVPGDVNQDTRMDAFVANENTDANGHYYASVFISTCAPSTGTPTLTATPTSTDTPVPLTSTATATAGTATGTATATATSIPCPPAWDVVPSPNRSEAIDSHLYAVSALSPNDIWAVGNEHIGGTYQPLIEHWDGTHWTMMSTPQYNLSVLRGVTALSPENVWAVGNYDAGTSGPPLVLHWDGTAWTQVSVPYPGQESSGGYLNGVAAIGENDIWTVGDYVESGAPPNMGLLIEHWDGSQWSIVLTNTNGSSLKAVSAISSSDVWAVGETPRAGGWSNTLTMHWDGTTWSTVPSPNPDPAAADQLNGVLALSTNDVWAVGQGNSAPFIMHWDGSAWHMVPVAGDLQNVTLSAVAGNSANDIWAVGNYGTFPGIHTLALHWNGVNWQQAYTPNVDPSLAELSGVAIDSAGSAWAAGTRSDTRTLIERYRPGNCCQLNFSDVATSDYFYEAVRHLYCNGAISGYSDGTFRPYNNTTRGQLAKIVVLAEGWSINTTGGPHFVDVPPGNAFYPYVETAYNRGVISGYADNTFRWGNNVTRAQLCKIVVNAQGWGIDTTGGPHFTDVPSTDPFYGFIETAYNHLIISGYADQTFRPGNNATRGQISKIVYQAITQP